MTWGPHDLRLAEAWVSSDGRRLDGRGSSRGAAPSREGGTGVHLRAGGSSVICTCIGRFTWATRPMEPPGTTDQRSASSG